MPVRSRFTARSAAEAIGRELAAGDPGFALRMLVTAITDLRAVLSPADLSPADLSLAEQAALAGFVVPPPTTGSLRWDTLLAASVGRELRRAGVDRPDWTMPPHLEQWWFVNEPPSLLFARIMQRTPPDLACLGIWLDAKSFETL